VKLKIKRYSLQIVPEDITYGQSDKRDEAFIEEVLGLQKDGDSIRLIRRNASRLSCIAYLETEKKS